MAGLQHEDLGSFLGCLASGFLLTGCVAVGAGTGYTVLEEQQVPMAAGALMPGTHKYVIPDQDRRGPSGASLRKYARRMFLRFSHPSLLL